MSYWQSMITYLWELMQSNHSDWRSPDTMSIQDVGCDSAVTCSSVAINYPPWFEASQVSSDTIIGLWFLHHDMCHMNKCA